MVVAVVVVVVSCFVRFHFGYMRNKCRRVSTTLNQTRLDFSYLLRPNTCNTYNNIYWHVWKLLLHFTFHTEIRRIFIFGLDILNRRTRAPFNIYIFIYTIHLYKPVCECVCLSAFSQNKSKHQEDSQFIRPRATTFTLIKLLLPKNI